MAEEPAPPATLPAEFVESLQNLSVDQLGGDTHTLPVHQFITGLKRDRHRFSNLLGEIRRSEGHCYFMNLLS